MEAVGLARMILQRMEELRDLPHCVRSAASGFDPQNAVGSGGFGCTADRPDHDDSPRHAAFPAMSTVLITILTRWNFRDWGVVYRFERTPSAKLGCTETLVDVFFGSRMQRLKTSAL